MFLRIQHSMKLLFTFFFLAIYASAIGQELPSRSPDSVFPLDFSVEGEKVFTEGLEKFDKLSQKMSQENLNYEDLSKAEKQLLDRYEMAEDYWEIGSPGCSWYCGGGPYAVTASSALYAHKEIRYDAENAHDLDYETAWVEGVQGLGNGEFLTYTFEPQSPRITEITIINGYIKSEKAWRENGRVKTLRIWINEVPFSDFELDDSRSEQVFEVEPLGKYSADKPWTLRFEIVAAYPGEKYEDVAITEIYFDGLDVHCFPAGTAITMANYSTVPIEQLGIGQAILTYDPQHARVDTAIIEEMANSHHCQFIQINLANGMNIVATPDHPFFTAQHTWVSYEPEVSRLRYDYVQVSLLTAGISLLAFDPVSQSIYPTEIQSVRLLHEAQLSYTLTKLSHQHTFIANGILVGTEALSQDISLLNLPIKTEP